MLFLFSWAILVFFDLRPLWERKEDLLMRHTFPLPYYFLELPARFASRRKSLFLREPIPPLFGGVFPYFSF